MQRKIQFNAWDTQRKKMIPNVAVYEHGAIGFNADTAREVYGIDCSQWPGRSRVSWVFMGPDEVIILQSSEMPDMMGNMMYDGHVVKCAHLDAMEDPMAPLYTYHHITFRNGSFGWLGEITGEFYPFSEDPLRDAVIVGNIFQNPELLELNKQQN